MRWSLITLIGWFGFGVDLGLLFGGYWWVVGLFNVFGCVFIVLCWTGLFDDCFVVFV